MELMSLAGEGLKIIWDKRESFIKWLFLEGPLWLRVPPLLFLGLFFLFTVWAWKGISAVQEVSLETLAANLEQTPQPNKGLEALALAGLDREIETEYRQYTTTYYFTSALNNFQGALANNIPKLPVTNSEKNPDSQQDISLSVVTLPTNGSQQDSDGKLSITKKYVTDSYKSGYLFVPAMVLNISVPSGQVSDEELNKVITEAAEDPRNHISEDILASQQIRERLYDLLNIQAFEFAGKPPEQLVLNNLPVQAYFITRTGVIRICENGIGKDNQSDYYSDQFKATTFFPDRPYFWDTVNEPKYGVTLNEPVLLGQDRLHITKPYIDLGGNGIVVTMSRSIEAPHISEAGLFLDFGLGSKAKVYIKERLNKLGGSSREIACTAGQVDPQQVLSEREREILERRIKEKELAGSLSDIFGQIQVLSSDSSSKKIVFTIPLGSTTAPRSIGSPGGRRSGTLLYCELDLAGLKNQNILRAGLAAVFFMLFLIFSILLIVDYVLRLKEQEKAFHSVAGMMLKAPVAYCRLNEEDKFVDINETFARMLGYKGVVQAKKDLKGKPFVELLADDESQDTYENVKKVRLARQPTAKYTVSLSKYNDEGIVTVDIYGAAVPMPAAKRKYLPQTFGILVERKKD
jgi:PAS domain S-box-containing protein